MDVREKLVELLSQIQSYGVKQGSHVTHQEGKTNREIASYLIAHGVTVQEWISVKDRLPESEKDAVMIALRWGAVDIGWCEEGRWGSEFVNEYDDGEVTHWIPMPPAPEDLK